MSNILPDISDLEQSSEADFASVTIDTPFDAIWLRDFIGDPQRVLRINSLLEFQEFVSLDEDRWHMAGKNLANGKEFDVIFALNLVDNGLRLSFENGLKTATELRVEDDGSRGAKLTITDDYSGVSKEQRQQRLNEVDNSIMQWGHDIHRYLHQWKRWSFLPGWQAYMLRFWQNMKPSARRISFMLIALTIGEFVIFLLVFAIFWLEMPRMFAE